MKHSPPKWIDKLLERLCSPDFLEEVQGDLHESFHWRASEKGLNYASWHFIKEAVMSFRLPNLKFYTQMDQFFTLLKSYFRTGWRFLWKTKSYSSINVLGLSVGIVFSWFAYLYSADQFGYNKHLKNVENLHRISMQATMFDNKINFPGISHETVQRLLDEMPEVENAARFLEETATIKLEEGTIEQKYFVAEHQLIDFLGLKFLEGESGDFEAPKEVIISEKLAYKLAIRGSAVGQYIQLLDSSHYSKYKIVGVFDAIPSNTSIQADLILPYTHYTSSAENLKGFDVSAILQLTPATDLADLDKKIYNLLNPEASNFTYHALITPLTALHLSENYFASNGFLPGGNRQLIWFIVIAGAMCLLISIINYANFSISLYLHRSQEMAVRKIIGSGNAGVFQQLMIESVLATFLASILAILLFLGLAPSFSLLVEKHFGLFDLLTIQHLPKLLLLFCLIAIISGSYPSLLLSKGKIIPALKGKRTTKKGAFATQSLLVVQFSISIIMIACMLIFRGQLTYLQDFDRGYDATNVYRIDFPTELEATDKKILLARKLKSIPDVSSVSIGTGFGMAAYDDGTHKLRLTTKNIDSSYLKMLGMQLLEGQLPHQAKENGISNGVLVNQRFLEQVGISENPIGKSIDYEQNEIIVGVIKDYYAFGPTSSIDPLLMYDKPADRYANHILVKSKSNFNTLQPKIDEVWTTVFDQLPLAFASLESIQLERFAQEQKITKVAGMGSLLAIFISAFGLLGLVGLTIQRKLKELSIRRILGANNMAIVGMIVQKFAVPITVSLALGISASFYLAEEWLSNYKNRIHFEIHHGALAAGAVILVLLIIMLVQTIKVTQTNPAIHLKDD